MAGADRGRILLCYGGFFVVFVFTAVLLAVREPFPTTLDELPHYSYVAKEAQAPSLLPDYGAMRLVDPAHLTRFTDTPYFFNHPAAYYLLMSPVLRLAPGTVLPLRLANAALAALAVLLLFVVASRRLESVSQHAAFAGLLTGFPKLAVVASIVNNDNLAILGGALVVAALMRERGDLGSAILAGCGLAIGAWAKLTAAIMLGLLVLVYYLPSLRPVPRARHAVLLLFAAVGALPYIANLLAFGAPFWEASALSHHGAQGAVHAPLTLVQFLGVFFETLPETWAAVGPSDPLDLAGALAAFAVFAASLPASRLSQAVAIALVGTLFVHFGYEYVQQSRFGIWAGSYGASPRYYLPLWPGVAFGAALALGRIRRSRVRAAAAAALLLVFAYGFPVVAAIRYPLMHPATSALKAQQ